ncbi:VMAP-C domain-containing protein [Streptomyces sp. NPDC055210]
MGTASESGEFGRESARDLLFRLTETLCGLSCLEDQAGRQYFAGVLSEQLNASVDVRGVKQREDVVILVRTALGVPDGERVLVDVVRVFEGSAAAAVVGQLLAPVAGQLPAGPLSAHDRHAALALLGTVAEGLPAGRLRDCLAGELQFDLPVGLTCAQLFSYAGELNVQPDGLPPAVLLMDHAARLTDIADRRSALSSWAQDWARHAGLLAELEQRRTERVAVEADPSIPRCLVVAVEPARDGTDDVVVRPWLNTVPGRWHPQPGEPETTSLGRLGSTVERALHQVVRLSRAALEVTPVGAEPTPPFVEFVLPYDLLNHDVAGMTFRSGDGSPLPLGLKYGVHLRSLERMRTEDSLVRAQWFERWNTLQTRGIEVHGWRASDPRDPMEWQAALAARPSRTATVLDAPDGGPATEMLKAAIAEGIGLAVWDRRGEFVAERREVVTAVFAAVGKPAQLPVTIHRLRQIAQLHSDGPLLLGRHIAFMWDDPHRLVDMQPLSDLDVVMRDGVGLADSAGTIDSEETPV